MNARFFLLCCQTMSLVVGSCDTRVVSDVSVIHQLTPGAIHSYAFVPFKDQEGSVEFETYASLIRNQLSAIDYTEVPLDFAQVIVFFTFGTGGNVQIPNNYPTFGQPGISDSTTTQSMTPGNTNQISPNSTSTPVYGAIGPRMTTDTPLARVLIMQIVDRQASVNSGKVQILYEGRVTSAGPPGSLDSIMPAMVAALFSDFPGKSGSTTSITAALPRN